MTIPLHKLKKRLLASPEVRAAYNGLKSYHLELAPPMTAARKISNKRKNRALNRKARPLHERIVEIAIDAKSPKREPKGRAIQKQKLDKLWDN
jgi:hypothetical protein